jgi:hypothetical protein
MTARTLSTTLCAVLVVLAASHAAAAGPPQHFVVSFDDHAFEAAEAAKVTAACGTPIGVDLKGKVVVNVLDKPTARGVVEIAAFGTRATYTNVETGATLAFTDAGPDVVRFDPATGHVQIAITGRSITGSGVIGRVVVDLQTGETLAVSGLEIGDYVELVCDAIA